MQNITSTTELKRAIEVLEAEHLLIENELKKQFSHTYELLKPVNILRDILGELTSSSFLIDNILSTATGLVSGFVSQKIVSGSSASKLRKLLGSVIQLGVTSFVAKHSGKIKAYTELIIKYFIHIKKGNPAIL